MGWKFHQTDLKNFMLRAKHVDLAFFCPLQNHSHGYLLLIRTACNFSKVVSTKVTNSYTAVQAFSKVWVSSPPVLTLCLLAETSRTAFEVNRPTGRKVIKVHRDCSLIAKYQETKTMRPSKLRVIKNFEYMILSLKFLLVNNQKLDFLLYI